MNRVIAAIVLLCAGVMVDANADCLTNQVTDLQTLLLGQHVCAVRGSDVWRERHDAPDKLFDIKKGLSDPVDPEKLVGTWKVTEKDKKDKKDKKSAVTYTYNAFGPAVSFTYKVYKTGPSTYDFCDVNTPTNIVANATIQAAPCPLPGP